MMNNAIKQQAAFTLIELMIVVVIISVLTMIAMPSYDNHVRKSRRADAQASLLELAQFMERHYTAQGGYYTNGRTGGNPTLPYTTAPKDGGNTFYTLTVSVTSSENYTLSAAPAGAMTGDNCGTLSLNSMGVKGQSSGTLAECWRR